MTAAASFQKFDPLTTAQMSTLKALAAADSAAAALMASADDIALAAWFNAQKAPAFVVWRSVLTPSMARAAIIKGASQLDNLTVGKRDALLYLVSGDLDPSIADERDSIDALCGTQATLKSALQAAERRNASRAEAALATGTGSTAVPATLGWEGELSYGEASTIRSQ